MHYRRIGWVGLILLLAMLPWIVWAIVRTPVTPLEPLTKLHDAEGFALIKSTSAREQYRGAGVSIAVIDTGIDISHAAFGATTDATQNTNNKVIGGINLSASVPNANQRPDTSSKNELHGTSVAGIIAGDHTGTTSGYIGGVALDARIYSVKAIGTSGTTLDKIYSAWEWVLEHQWDDPNNPIVVINNSIGITSLANGLCDSAIDSIRPGFTQLINRINAAGITIVASSGNNGSCAGMPFPACHSGIVSVGAVYDDNFDSLTSWQPSNSCAVLPVKDTLVCATSKETGIEKCRYPENRLKGTPLVASNAPDFLELVAPSYKVMTTDFAGASGLSNTDYTDRFGQTSAAGAYASGAVALLQSAALKELNHLLSVNEVRQVLRQTGIHTVDYRSNRNYPLINIEAAISQLESFKSAAMIPWIMLLLLDE